jgi:hypothetical protein
VLLLAGHMPTNFTDLASYKSWQSTDLTPGMQYGPLTTSALALFGNNSYFRSVWDLDVLGATNNTSQSVCESFYEQSPFGRFKFEPEHSTVGREFDLYNSRSNCNSANFGTGLSSILPRIVYNFHSLRRINDALSVSMFLSNVEFLNSAILYRQPTAILNVPGEPIALITGKAAAVIAVSILLGSQLLLLLLLTLYIYHTPTWTGTFDAMAMAKIGQALSKDVTLLPLGDTVSPELSEKLTKLSGIIGVIEEGNGDCRDTSGDVEMMALPAADAPPIGTSGNENRPVARPPVRTSMENPVRTTEVQSTTVPRDRDTPSGADSKR